MSHYNSKQFDASVCRFADREDCARNACWFALAKNPVTERFHANPELYGSIEQVNERGQHSDVYGVFVMPLGEEEDRAFLSNMESRCDALFIGWFVCDGLLDKAWVDDACTELYEFVTGLEDLTLAEMRDSRNF